MMDLRVSVIDSWPTVLVWFSEVDFKFGELYKVNEGQVKAIQWLDKRKTKKELYIWAHCRGTESSHQQSRDGQTKLKKKSDTNS